MKIRVHNAALQRNLTANEAKVYAYLIACSNRLNNAVVRIDTIREACCIGSRTTVYTALQGLAGKGLVHKYRRHSYDGNLIANGYSITPLRGGWFEVDTMRMEIFKLDKSSFLIYLFFLKCRRPKARKVFPSLNKIAKALATCKNTVIKAIKTLIRLCIITKSRPAQPGRLNLYLILNPASVPTTKSFADNQDNLVQTIVTVRAPFVKSIPTVLYYLRQIWQNVYRLTQRIVSAIVSFCFR
jgi:predicted transcriptional regulator